MLQDGVQYGICIPSTVHIQAFHHIYVIFFFFFISGYNDATDLSLGDILDRMKNQKKSKRVKCSSV